MNISLRQMRIFEATVRLGRLTLAAEEQAISQSAASQAIREFERALGYAVLHRTGRALVPSDAGQQVLPRVRRILRLSEDLVQPDSDRVAGPFRVAASVTIACYLLPRLLADFAERYPAAEPKLEIHNTEAVLGRLEKGQAHLGMIEGPALHASLDIVAWRSDELALFCAPDHPLAQVGAATMEQLAAQKWIVREAGSGTRAVFDTAMQAIGLRPRIALQLDRQEAIKQSVRAGLGMGCLSALAIVDEVRAGHLVRLDTPLNLTRQFSWVCSPENRDRALIRAFLEQLEAPDGPDRI